MKSGDFRNAAAKSVNNSVRGRDDFSDGRILALGDRTARFGEGSEALDCGDDSPGLKVSVGRRVLGDEGANRFDVADRLW